MRAAPLFLAAITGVAAPAFAAVTAEPTPEQTAFFESKIRPILADNCYKCHSLENGKSKGGLTLDTRDGVLKGGEVGPVVVPGNPAASPLIKAVKYEDKDLQMPPSKEGGKLKDEQIAALTEWVKMGAPDPRKEVPKTKLTGLTAQARKHWSYQPVTKPEVPAIKNRVWCRTPVDGFILSKIEAKGMVPSPDASKETLLRRATYDLTGLPPTPQEVTDFLSDESAQAFSKVIERLLASPAYGERWGRYWLDTARYADTIGGMGNNGRMDYRFPYAWTYRDYVIKAFNDDKPYDQFIVEQLAADKLPDIKPDDPRLAALGFITVGERFNNVNDVINDRIDTVTKGFLGMTVSCARCHDHKFDPIPTKDYYALHGVFSSITEPAAKPVIGMPALDQLTDFHGKLDTLEQDIRDGYYKALADETAKFRSNPTGYLLAAQARKGNASASEMKAAMDMMKERKLDPELVQDVSRNVRSNDPVFAPFRALMNIAPAEFAAKAPAIIAEYAGTTAPAPADDKKERRKAPKVSVNPLVVAALKDAKPQSLDDVAAIYDKLFASLQPRAAEFFRAAASTKTLPPSGFDPAVVQMLEIPYKVEAGGGVSMEKFREMANRGPRKFANRAGQNSAKINELLLTHPGVPVRAMTIADLSKPKDSPVFIRGQAQTRGEIVPRRFLEVLSQNGGPVQFPKDSSGRFELAQCIASKTNPLTARVLVNRVWMHHFGEGFVPTPDDLGTQSEPPTHPELLDYLASYFMEKGWSIKQLHRVIMLSRIYQVSSSTIPDYEAIDSQNRLLWRANIRRLDFEAMRDSLLAMSGKLDRTIGGQPINLTDEPYSYRRSVYGYIDRGNLPELMQSFDFSDPDMTNSKRATSIVPQQALFLMNSAMSVDVARRVVARPEVAGARDDLSRVVAIYRVIFQRNPKPAELQMATKFLGLETKTPAEGGNVAADLKTTAKIVAKRAEAKKSASGTKAIQNEGEIVDRRPLTAWETYAQALLFSNEAAYVN
jgi:mono/diheme cytochrome c family protein